MVIRRISEKRIEGKVKKLKKELNKMIQSRYNKAINIQYSKFDSY